MEKTRSFLSRRNLLIGLGGIVAATAAIMVSPFRGVIAVRGRELVRNQPALRRMLLSLADAGHDEWAEQVGSILSLGGGTSLKLVAVSALASSGERPAGLRDSAFLAKFDVQNGATMAGDLIYTALHPSYGAFQIFLSASTDPSLPHRMIAIFN